MDYPAAQRVSSIPVHTMVPSTNCCAPARLRGASAVASKIQRVVEVLLDLRSVVVKRHERMPVDRVHRVLDGTHDAPEWAGPLCLTDYGKNSAGAHMTTSQILYPDSDGTPHLMVASPAPPIRIRCTNWITTAANRKTSTTSNSNVRQLRSAG